MPERERPEIPPGAAAHPGAPEGDGPHCYLVALDLGRRSEYSDLEEALRAYPASARILDGLWGVVSERGAPDIRDHLWQFIHPDDGIFVVRSGRDAAWQDVLCENRWLKTHL